MASVWTIKSWQGPASWQSTRSSALFWASRLIDITGRPIEITSDLITHVDYAFAIFHFPLLSFQSEAADGLHSGIQRRDRPERNCVGILAARYFANAPRGGVSPGKKRRFRFRQFVRRRMNDRSPHVTLKFERILQGGGMQSDGNWSSVRLVPGKAARPRHVHFQLGHLRRLWHRLSDRPLCNRTECLGSGELILPIVSRLTLSPLYYFLLLLPPPPPLSLFALVFKAVFRLRVIARRMSRDHFRAEGKHNEGQW